MKKTTRKKWREEKKKSESEKLDSLFDSDDTFYFIAGYTPGGAPFGITWEEMEGLKMLEKIFKGKWQIIDMDMWGVDSNDWYIEFDGKGNGSFHFICIEAEIDYRIDKNKTLKKSEFTFYGSDNGDEVFGRGFAEIDGENLVGNFCFHQGDESRFKAKRIK